MQYTSVLLLLIPYSVSAFVPGTAVWKGSWMHSVEFTRFFNMFQLSWPNKTSLSYDGLINHFLQKSMERHKEDRLRVKNYGRNFTCTDGAWAELSTYNGVIEGLKTIGHHCPVRLKKSEVHSFRLRATLTIQRLTVKYNYFLNVQTEGGKSSDFKGTASFTVKHNVLNVDFKFNVGSDCEISMERPAFLETADYAYNITGLEGTDYARDLERQCQSLFIVKLKRQIEIFYYFLFAKVENKHVITIIVYGAFASYYEKTAVDAQRKKYHPKSLFRSIYLNRQKGYHLDKYGKNVGAKNKNTNKNAKT